MDYTGQAVTQSDKPCHLVSTPQQYQLRVHVFTLKVGGGGAGGKVPVEGNE
jgi:hypothetical protein